MILVFSLPQSHPPGHHQLPIKLFSQSQQRCPDPGKCKSSFVSSSHCMGDHKCPNPLPRKEVWSKQNVLFSLHMWSSCGFCRSCAQITLTVSFHKCEDFEGLELAPWRAVGAWLGAMANLGFWQMFSLQGLDMLVYLLCFVEETSAVIQNCWIPDWLDGGGGKTREMSRKKSKKRGNLLLGTGVGGFVPCDLKSKLPPPFLPTGSRKLLERAWQLQQPSSYRSHSHCIN